MRTNSAADEEEKMTVNGPHCGPFLLQNPAVVILNFFRRGQGKRQQTALGGQQQEVAARQSGHCQAKTAHAAFGSWYPFCQQAESPCFFRSLAVTLRTR